MNFSCQSRRPGHVHVVAQGMQQRGSTISRGHLWAGSWASATVSALLSVFHHATTQTDPHRIRACYFPGQTKKNKWKFKFPHCRIKNFTVTIQIIWAHIQYCTWLYVCTDTPKMQFTGCRLSHWNPRKELLESIWMPTQRIRFVVPVCSSCVLFSWFCRHTASALIISGTHTCDGAVIGEPGSARLEGTPAMDLGLERIHTSCRQTK